MAVNHLFRECERLSQSFERYSERDGGGGRRQGERGRLNVRRRETRKREVSYLSRLPVTDNLEVGFDALVVDVILLFKRRHGHF